MGERDESKHPEQRELSLSFSSDFMEASPSLEKILQEVSDKLHSYRSLTPTRYRDKEPKSISKNNHAESLKIGTDPSFEKELEEKESRQPSDDMPVILQDIRPRRTEGMHGEPGSSRQSQWQDQQEKVVVEPPLPNQSGIKRLFPMWYTSEMYREKNRNIFIYLAIQEFLIFIIFLISVSIVAFGSFSTIMYYYSFVISDIFTKSKFASQQGLQVTFREIKTIPQLWDFMTDSLIDTLFFEYFEDKHTMMTHTMEESKLVLLDNVLVGVPRIRQVRVRPDSCKVPQDFVEVFRACYGYYKPSTESRDSYGVKKGSQWTYTKNIANEYVGKISTYGTGGYYLNLTRNYLFSKTMVQNLHERLWIDHGTRAIFIDFTLYTPNVNLFCVVKLVAELPPSGGVISSANIYTLKLIRYVSYWDHVMLGFEVLAVIMLILYTAEEIREMIVLKWSYIYHPWNIIDMTIVILGWNLFTIGYVRYHRISMQMPDLIKTINKDNHANFDSLAEIQRTFNTVCAFFVTVVWIKLIKYMMLIKVMYHLLKTIGKCAYELLGLTFILIVLVISFALLGHLLFGSQVEEFGTIGQSIISLMVLSVGALDYKKVQEARPFLGPLYFMLFIYFFILIFLCLFVAVIVNGFTMVRFDIMEDRDKLYLKNIIFNFLKNIFNHIRMKGLAERLKEKLRTDAVNENYQVVIDILRRSGFRGEETKLFLKKHKIEKGKMITREKMEEIYEDIDGKGQLYIEAVEHEHILNEVDLLRLRMAYSDKMIEELASKVELLLEKVTKKN